jgi:hypothetical protein
VLKLRFFFFFILWAKPHVRHVILRSCTNDRSESSKTLFHMTHLTFHTMYLRCLYEANTLNSSLHSSSSSSFPLTLPSYFFLQRKWFHGITVLIRAYVRASPSLILLCCSILLQYVDRVFGTFSSTCTLFCSSRSSSSSLYSKCVHTVGVAL